MPGKGILIDTPGLRELQLWTDQGNVIRTFRDIEDLKTQCRFRNCSHASEPGCAITSALEDGSLDPEHYKSYLKQQREMRYLKRKQNERNRMIEKMKFKRKVG
jgi:ribosome biogenesis GTPase